MVMLSTPFQAFLPCFPVVTRIQHDERLVRSTLRPRLQSIRACANHRVTNLNPSIDLNNNVCDALALAISQRQTSRIPRLLRTALSAPSSATPVSLATLRAVISVCLSTSDFRALSAILRMALSSHLTTCLRLPHLVAPLRALATAGWWRAVFTTLDVMSDLSKTRPALVPDSRMLVGLANVAVECGTYSDSLRVFAWMRDHNIPLGPIAYSVMFKSHGRALNIVAVKRLITELRELQIPVDTILLNSAIDALIRCNDLRTARDMLLNETYAQTVDIMTYNTVIKGLVQNGQRRDAFRLASRMQAAGFRPNAVTVNTLMSACVAARDFETAWQLLDYYATPMNKRKIRISPPSPPRPPSTPPELRKSLLSSKKISDLTNNNTVSRPHDHVEKEVENVNIGSQLNSVDATRLKRDKTDTVELGVPLNVRTQIKNNGSIEINEEEDLKQLRIAMTTLLCGLAEACRINDALKLLSEMHVRGVKPSSITYASLISACFNQGQVDQAMILFNATSSSSCNDHVPPCDLHILNAVITGLCHRKDVQSVEEAADIITYMLRQSKSEQHERRDNDQNVKKVGGLVKPAVATVNILLDGFVRFGMFDRAEYFMGMIRQFGIFPNVSSYTTLMKGYADAKQFDSAKRIFRQMSRRKVRPDRVAMNAFVAVCARSGDAEAAGKILEFMEHRGRGLSPTAQSYSPILMLFARENKDDLLWKLYDRMRQQGVSVNDYIMEMLCEYVVKAAAASTAPQHQAFLEHLAQKAGSLLRDGLKDGVTPKLLRIGKRMLTASFPNQVCQKYFGGLNSAEFRSASETIFERHGWNDIESGWRFL